MGRSVRGETFDEVEETSTTEMRGREYPVEKVTEPKYNVLITMAVVSEFTNGLTKEKSEKLQLLQGCKNNHSKLSLMSPSGIKRPWQFYLCSYSVLTH